MKLDANTLVPWALIAAGTIGGVYALSAYTIDVKVKPKQSDAEREVEQARRQVARKQGEIEARLAALKAKASDAYGDLQGELLDNPLVQNTTPRRRS
jgi:parvulin-like peptidyl-prolyl isomerase